MGMKNSLIALSGKTLGGGIDHFFKNLSTELNSESHKVVHFLNEQTQ